MRSVSALVLLLTCAASACRASGSEPPGSHRASIPPRSADAITGSEFARRTTGMSGQARQGAAVAEILAGNVPEFVRALRPVYLEFTPPGAAAAVTATVWVTPDYLAIGSDEDFLRMPLTVPSIAAVARAFDMTLPTPRIVAAIYEQADRRLSPAPLPPSPRMRSSGYYLRHRELIEGQYGGWPRTDLVAGHKKDVVLTGRLRLKPDRIAIFGWHRSPGKPIQPLSTVHDSRYADYSHGARLVDVTVEVEGKERSFFDVLADPGLAPVLSDEGPIAGARDLLGDPRAAAPPPAPAASADG